MKINIKLLLFLVIIISLIICVFVSNNNFDEKTVFIEYNEHIGPLRHPNMELIIKINKKKIYLSNGTGTCRKILNIKNEDIESLKNSIERLVNFEKLKDDGKEKLKSKIGINPDYDPSVIIIYYEGEKYIFKVDETIGANLRNKIFSFVGENEINTFKKELENM